eukprot:scaffold119817_cov69-Phaeocystis_antarctica.AAC.2
MSTPSPQASWMSSMSIFTHAPAGVGARAQIVRRRALEAEVVLDRPPVFLLPGEVPVGEVRRVVDARLAYLHNVILLEVVLLRSKGRRPLAVAQATILVMADDVCVGRNNTANALLDRAHASAAEEGAVLEHLGARARLGIRLGPHLAGLNIATADALCTQGRRVTLLRAPDLPLVRALVRQPVCDTDRPAREELVTHPSALPEVLPHAQARSSVGDRHIALVTCKPRARRVTRLAESPSTRHPVARAGAVLIVAYDRQGTDVQASTTDTVASYGSIAPMSEQIPHRIVQGCPQVYVPGLLEEVLLPFRDQTPLVNPHVVFLGQTSGALATTPGVCVVRALGRPQIIEQASFRHNRKGAPVSATRLCSCDSFSDCLCSSILEAREGYVFRFESPPRTTAVLAGDDSSFGALAGTNDVVVERCRLVER